jgi:hypothetical protein
VGAETDGAWFRSPTTALAASGGAGLVLGGLKATFQDAVETGQVIAGIVQYPVDNPYFLYHTKVFSIVNQFSAVLLTLLGSEKVASFVVSALMGMLAIQAASMVVFMVNRDARLAVGGGLLVYFTSYLGYQVLYHIFPPFGISSTYGVLGLSFTVLTIALLGAGCERAAMFCLGLAPAVHPSYGVWLYLVTGLSLLVQRDQARRLLRAGRWHFAAGFALALSCLLHQLHLMRYLPAMDPERKRQYFLAFLESFDYHRQKFYWDRAAQRFKFLHDGVIFCIFSVAAGGIGLRLFRERPALRLVARLVVLSGVLSLVVAGITHLDPERVPMWVLAFMPGRYVNIGNYLLAPFLLGVLTSREGGRVPGSRWLFLLMLLSAATMIAPLRHAALAAILLALAAGSLAPPAGAEAEPGRVARLLARFRAGPGPAAPGHGACMGLFLGVFLLVYLQSMGPGQFVSAFFHSREQFDYCFRNAFFEEVAKRRGMLVTSTDVMGAALFTRRPVLLNVGSAFDGFSMVPESGDAFNHILRRVYGVDLLAAPRGVIYAGELDPRLYRGLWERRTVAEWQDLRREFGVTEVLADADWRLALPQAASDGNLALFPIPGGPP